MTVLEAMALGLPVVAIAAGELPYIIQQGQEGSGWGHMKCQRSLPCYCWN
jgi:hypothetical protein